MMSAGDHLEGQRYERVLCAISADRQEHEPGLAGQKPGAKFLGDMRRNAYVNTNSVQDRLLENRHYSQR